MNPLQAALYAACRRNNKPRRTPLRAKSRRCASASPLDGLVLPEAMQFLDEGYSGATLVRPALERLRDVVAAGSGRPALCPLAGSVGPQICLPSPVGR